MSVLRMPSVLGLFDLLGRVPKGRLLFSVAFARKAPYFASVKPRFTELRPHRAALVVANRRAVHNHIGTVHAIAVCNGLEAAMGALAEATIPAGKRWLPKGMQVEYVAKATSDISCVAETTEADWAGPDVPVTVTATRDDGTVVVRGVIQLWVTDKPAA
ncbi:MAG: hotdog fold domain-containing protein [Nocardioidaceae bacterium]